MTTEPKHPKRTDAKAKRADPMTNAKPKAKGAAAASPVVQAKAGPSSQTKPDAPQSAPDASRPSAAEKTAKPPPPQPPALPPLPGDAQAPPPDQARRSDQGLDPRINAFRPDLAAGDLIAKVSARRYVDGEWSQVRQAVVPVRSRPDARAGFVTEALFGELVTVFDATDGWSWIQLSRDRYVGYVPTESLNRDIVWPTHHVRALGTFVYAEPDIKSAPVSHLSINSPVAVASGDDSFCELATGGYVVRRHLAEEGKFARDFVDIAELMIGTPYLWGGSSRLGIDCSGLVQMSLLAAGVAAPRDSDMQQAELGDTVLVPEDLEGLQRGDLVFWPGHVGVMSDGLMVVHANAHHMSVTVETLPEVADRIARNDGPAIAAIKRLGPSRSGS